MNLVTGKLYQHRKVLLAVSLLSLLAIPLAACRGTTGQSPLLPTEPEAVVSSTEQPRSPLAESLASVTAKDPELPSPPAAPLISEPTIITEPVLLTTGFEINDLVIDPAEVQPGEQITITAKLINNSESEGSDEIELKINGVTQVVKEVTLATGETQELYFSGYMMPGIEPGTYTASLGELNTQFIVSETPETLLLSSPDTEAATRGSNNSGGCSGCGSSSNESSCGCRGSANTTSQSGCSGCGG